MKLKDLGILPEKKTCISHPSNDGCYCEECMIYICENDLIDQIGEIEIEIDEEKIQTICEEVVQNKSICDVSHNNTTQYCEIKNISSLSGYIAKALSQGDILKIKGE